jgi:DNA-binding NarL/FixJ family response regulator
LAGHDAYHFHPDFLRGLTVLIVGHGEVVDALARSLAEKGMRISRNRSSSLDPSLAILPFEQWADRPLGLPVLVHSAPPSSGACVRLLEAGAEDVCQEGASPAEIAARIAAVLRRTLPCAGFG